MGNLLDIGEVASRSGMAASTLRYYEREGMVASGDRNGLHRSVPCRFNRAMTEPKIRPTSPSKSEVVLLTITVVQPGRFPRALVDQPLLGLVHL